MIKFDDEMLSKVLTAHNLGELIRYGCTAKPSYPGCLFQVALEVSDLNRLDELGWCDDRNSLQMNKFDAYYNSDWTEEEFLEFLFGIGIK